MAIILRGAAKTAAAEPSFSLRTTTVEVAQTGLISKITGPSNQSINVVNLGCQGDHNVSELRIKPWISANVLKNNYLASLIFYSEQAKEEENKRVSLDLSPDGDEYVLQIPRTITEKGGNYQIFLSFREKLSTESGSGTVGDKDDPAYREVFISAAFKGAVNTNSGYQFVKKFKNTEQETDWTDHLYNYNLGVIQLSDSLWQGDGPEYTTTVYLGGLSTVDVNDIEIITPEDEIEVVSKTLEDGKALIITIQVLNSKSLDKLDDIIVKYPVTFSATMDANNQYAQKPAIQVKYDQSSLTIVSANKSLGMKLDSYVTPIDLTRLYNLDTTTEKYTIFSKDDKTYICKAQNEICWIPVGVTNNPGTWSVSFIGESADKLYFTDVLKLSVVDNVLTRESLNSDTVYTVMQSVDGLNLYDSNDTALYLIDSGYGSGKLSYTKGVIDQAIGWVTSVDDISVSGLRLAVEKTPELQSSISTLTNDLNTVSGNISSINTQISNLQAKDNELILQLEELDDKIQASDTTALDERLTTAEGKITNIESDLNTAEGKIATNERNITGLQAADTTLNRRVTNNETSINNINTEITTIKNQDQIQDTKINQNKAASELLKSEIDFLNTSTIPTINQQIGAINNTLEDHSKTHGNYLELLTNEIERSIGKDVALENEINSEKDRATTEEERIVGLLEVEANRAKKAEGDLDTKIGANKTNVSGLQSGLQTTNTRVSSLELTTAAQSGDISRLTNNINEIQNDKTYIKNNFVDGAFDDKPYVARIVLIQHMSIQDVAQMAKVPYETADQQAAFRNELINANIIKEDTNLNQPLFAEQVIEILRFKQATEKNTLYLIQEEE